jgi:hypothetical protein
MTNSDFVDRQAGGLARSLLERDANTRTRINHAYEVVFLRSPSEREIDRAAQFIESYLEVLTEEEGVPAEEHQRVAWTGFARGLLTSNEFLFVD